MQQNVYSGKFIVIEGLDGSGQSTQVRLLQDFLTRQGFDVVSTKEPTIDSEAGKKIRQILDEKEKLAPAALQELFTRDREEHLRNLIIPALEQGKIVITDRYFFSTFAFGVADDLDLEWLIGLNDQFLLPDLFFILRVKPEVCIQRIERRGEGIKLFEKEGKLRKVWQTYEILPERFDNVHMIDGEQSIEGVFFQIKTALSELNIKIKEDK